MLSKKQADFVSASFAHTLDVAEGTPRSGKTTACILRFFSFLNISQDTAHLVVAATQTQAFRLVMDGDGNGLLHLFAGSVIRHDEYGDYLDALTAAGRKKIYYKGGAKADSDKSIRGLSLGSVYFCEIDLLHPAMVQESFRRTFSADRRWHIADLNPPPPLHPVIRDVFDVQDTHWTHWTVADNPIITPERREELRAVLQKNPYLYKRDWLGERCVPQGVIYSMFDTQKHILPELPRDLHIIEMFLAGDGGTTDATSIGCYVVGFTGDPYHGQRRYTIYRVAGWYYDGGQKAMSTQAREIVGTFLPHCRALVGRRESGVKIDPACKALRLEVDKLGVPTERADNNGRDVRGNTKGIRVGIEYTQSAMQDGRFFLVENETFGHDDFLREIGLYCVDAHGNTVDVYNHAMDELRYAMNYFYKNYVL